MEKMARGCIVLALIATGAPAWAINKCTGSDGRVTYTDSPCEGGSRAARIDTPPPPTPAEQAEARARGERMVEDARALSMRQAAEAAARQRRIEAERAAEQAAQQRQARQEALREEAARLVIVQPVIPRFRPPGVPMPPRPRPVQPDRPAPMAPYPFR